MHYSTLAALAVLAAPFAGAQSLSDLPTCAQGPAEAGIGATGCALTDFQCICTAQAFISSLTTEIQSACSPSDQAATLAFAQQLCGSVGVTIPSPSSAAAASPAATTPMTTAMTTAVTTPVTTAKSPAATESADGQPEVPTSAAPLKTANATTVATSTPTVYKGSAAGLTAKTAALVLVGAVAAVFAL
ncbi:hypothetical protein MMC08_003987 [Hypocenomyce scalaris]|nr:hypothetical protein [Hypocenomyce scalaris]